MKKLLWVFVMLTCVMFWVVSLDIPVVKRALAQNVPYLYSLFISTELDIASGATLDMNGTLDVDGTTTIDGTTRLNTVATTDSTQLEGIWIKKLFIPKETGGSSANDTLGIVIKNDTTAALDTAYITLQ